MHVSTGRRLQDNCVLFHFDYMLLGVCMCTGKIGRCLARRGELVVAPDFNEAQETYHEVKAREDTAAYDQTEKVLVIRSSHTIIKPLRWEGREG